jgi:chemotaxis protein MotA
MDKLSLFGALLALTAILGGNLIEGGDLDALFNASAAVIVFGGTLGAGLLQTTKEEMRRSLTILRWMLDPPALDFSQGIEKVVGWSVHARRYGLLGLEREANLENNDFLRKGLLLLSDGCEVEQIREVLEVELNVREQRDLQATKVYENMGGYAPTIGIIGAVMGLIHVMTNLGDPSKLGSGIATAFVATIYGVGIANLFLLPIAGKLRTIVFNEYHYREMMIEGLVAVSEGHNALTIRSKLDGYLK